MIAEEQRLADVGKARDFLRRGGGVAAIGEELARRILDALAYILARAATATGAGLVILLRCDRICRISDFVPPLSGPPHARPRP